MLFQQFYIIYSVNIHSSRNDNVWDLLNEIKHKYVYNYMITTASQEFKVDFYQCNKCKLYGC